MSSLYSFLLAEEIIPKNPCMKIEKIKTEKIKKKAFTEIEVEQLRNACLSARETAIVEILLSTGCRVTELSLMTIVDIEGDRLTAKWK